MFSDLRNREAQDVLIAVCDRLELGLSEAIVTIWVRTPRAAVLQAPGQELAALRGSAPPRWDRESTHTYLYSLVRASGKGPIQRTRYGTGRPLPGDREALGVRISTS